MVVMPHLCGGGLAKEPVVVNWTEGRVGVGAAVDSRIPNVVLREVMRADGPRGPLFELRQTLEGVVSRFLAPDGRELRVQMFRYVGTDGVPRRLLWCGSCGHTMVCDLLEVTRMGRVSCRACGSPSSDRRCEGWHSFGVCGTCPPAAGVP